MGSHRLKAGLRKDKPSNAGSNPAGYRHLSDGEWSTKTKPEPNGTYLHRIKCCDCALEHNIQFKITKDGSLRFRAWRIARGKHKH